MPIQREDIDLHSILAQYSQYEADPTPMAGGNTNWSWRLRGQLILTVMADATVSAANTLARLLEHLERHKFSTNIIGRTDDGERCGTFQGRPVLLKYFMAGEVEADPDAEALRHIGAELAALHAVPPMDGLPKDHLYGLPEAPLVLASDIDPAFSRDLGAALARLQPVLTSDLPRGLIHGDLFHDNVLVYRGTDMLITILDFEEASISPFAADLGMAIIGLCIRDGAPDPEAIAALLQGYEAVRPLSAAERAAIPPLAALAAWACASWRFWRYHLTRPMPERADLHREMAELAVQLEAMSLPSPGTQA
jgi:homoserine kinase type II